MERAACLGRGGSWGVGVAAARACKMWKIVGFYDIHERDG